MCSCVALSHPNAAINLATLVNWSRRRPRISVAILMIAPRANASPQDVLFLRTKMANRTFVLDRKYHVVKSSLLLFRVSIQICSLCRAAPWSAGFETKEKKPQTLLWMSITGWMQRRESLPGCRGMGNKLKEVDKQILGDSDNPLLVEPKVADSPSLIESCLGHKRRNSAPTSMRQF